jgi:predicted ABC-type sugar transport system permease subunit
MSSLQLKVPSKELERSIQVKQCLEASPFLKKAVLAIVLFGTAMVVSDGVITPAMSGSVVCLFYVLRHDLHLLNASYYFEWKIGSYYSLASTVN